jgi:hypothetical protein
LRVPIVATWWHVAVAPERPEKAGVDEDAMMKRLVFLLLLGSCAGSVGTEDTPPSPALRDVKISFVHADPDWIKQRGQVIGLARSRDRTLAFSTLRWASRSCVVTLPYPWTVDETLYCRLRTHEERHCHGEEHHATQFKDEEPF